MSLKAWTLVICSAVNLYLLGVMVFFAAVSYPQLGAVDRSAFPSVYQALTSRIGLPVVVWEFVALLATVPLYFARPPSTPVWAVHVVIALGLAYFAITFAWHLPSHKALAAGDNSSGAMAPLLTSQWTRTVVQAARAGVLMWLGARLAS